MVQHALDQARAFRARQAEATMDDIGQVGPGQGRIRVGVIVDPRDAKVGHVLLPLGRLSPCRRSNDLVLNFGAVGNRTFVEMCRLFNRQCRF